MKKHIISIALALLMLISCFSGLALADGGISLPKSISEIVDAITHISIGDTSRAFMEATGFQDVHYALSPNGEAVTLKADPLSEEILKVIHSIGKYKVEYQWYAVDGKTLSATPLKGATGTSIMTNAFDETGIDFYFYQIKISQKLIFSYYLKNVFYSIPYAVAYTGLPTVIVNTADGKYISSNEEWIENCDLQIICGPNCDYNLDPTTIRIKGRGNTSWDASSKGGYTVKFEKKQDLFGIGKDKTWALVSNFVDKSLLRNWFASKLDKEVFDSSGKEFNVTQVPVDVIINGDYRGSFTLATTIRLGDNRVDVPDISDDITKDKNKDGVIDYYDAGFVVEIGGDDTYEFRTSRGVSMSLSDPDLDDPDEKNEAIYQHVVNVIQNAEDVMFSDNFADPDMGYAKYIDVDSFIDYYLLKELAKDVDADFGRSMYMYYQPKDGKIHMASSWDFDIAFGNTSYKGCGDPEGFYCNVAWYARLFEDPVFAEKVVNRWNETKDLLIAAVQNDLPVQADFIRTSAQMNFLKWRELGLPTWPTPEGWWSRWTVQSEVDYLTSWTMQRIAWLDGAYNAML